jgi:hypothetical protein
LAASAVKAFEHVIGDGVLHAWVNALHGHFVEVSVMIGTSGGIECAISEYTKCGGF